MYAQTEVVKDLIAARLAAGGCLEFEVTGTEVVGLDTDRPVLRYTAADGEPHEVICDAIAGCDGFHGICRPAIPAGLLTAGSATTRTPGWASWPTSRRPPTS